MKYLKLFEDVENYKTFSNLHYELIKFLKKLEVSDYSVVSPFYDRDNKKGIAIAFQYKDKRWGKRTIFSIRISEASDNKMKELLVKPKIKVKVDYYEITAREKISDEEFVLLLCEFINEVFKKYSYFYKFNNTAYHHKINDFFINTTNIPDIITELNEDFYLYINTKKYNI
jgi:hypothetical protein